MVFDEYARLMKYVFENPSIDKDMKELLSKFIVTVMNDSHRVEKLALEIYCLDRCIAGISKTVERLQKE